MTDTFVVYEEDYENYDNPLCQAIDDCGAVGQAKTDVWGDMISHAVAQGCGSEGDWVREREAIEDEWVRKRVARGEVFETTSSGKPVAKSTFPKLWNDYKGNIAKALRLGVSLVDDNGNYMRRSALLYA
jgi:hypothetical protein